MEQYVVQRGDSVYRIAERYAVPVQELVAVNQLQNPAILSAGQSLLIPTQSGTHTVTAGESLYAIARKYGVRLQSLIAANPQLRDPNRITVGQRIYLPPPEREIVVNGYMTNATDATLNQTLPYLTFLSAFSYRVEEDGSLTPTFELNLGLSEAQGVTNLMTVTNLRARGGFSSDLAHAILTQEQTQQRLIESILSVLAGGLLGGVNLDLEYVYPYDRGSYNQFLRRLANVLHARGYLLVTALAPKLSANQAGLLYEAHDYAFHGATADYVVLMTYEWGYTYGPAMAVAPINMVRRVLDYATRVIPAEKLLMGIPNYGYNWTLPFVQGTAASPLTNVRAVTLAGQVGAEIRFDGTAQAPFFRYTDDSGRRHEVWFEDARSLRAKLALVRGYGLAGVSFWNLNSLFRTNYLVLQSMYGIRKNLSY